jgi:UDP-N-acetylmuramoylalanine--D-glutamate ligase
MEVVGEAAGVVWYNDSKATNLGATRRVVESLDRPLVLILGGRDKGADFASLRDLLPGRTRHVILIGEARDVIARALGDAVPVTRVDGLADAVSLASGLARPGDAVLLAPACASFDAYRNFEERGEHFRSLVRKLSGRGDG